MWYVIICKYSQLSIFFLFEIKKNVRIEFSEELLAIQQVSIMCYSLEKKDKKKFHLY